MIKFLEWLCFWTRQCNVYLAQPMTGYDKKEVIKQAKMAVKVMKIFGLKAWSPVLHENIKGQGDIKNSRKTLDWKWVMDKKALDKCFVFVNLDADNKSFGCEDEYGRHRYSEWQPVVRVSVKHTNGYISIANYQTDFIASNTWEAAAFIDRNWGRWDQRFIWKAKLLNRSLLPWIGRQITRLFQ